MDITMDIAWILFGRLLKVILPKIVDWKKFQ